MHEIADTSFLQVDCCNKMLIRFYLIPTDDGPPLQRDDSFQSHIVNITCFHN